MNLTYELLYGFIHQGLDALKIEFEQHNLHRDDVRDLIASGLKLFELEAEVAEHIDPSEVALYRLILSTGVFYENLPDADCRRLMEKSVQAGRFFHEIFPGRIPSIDELVSAGHILLRQVQRDRAKQHGIDYERLREMILDEMDHIEESAPGSAQTLIKASGALVTLLEYVEQQMGLDAVQ